MWNTTVRLALAAMLLLVSTSASAGLIIRSFYERTFANQIFEEQTLNVVVAVDDSGLTGIGLEQVAAHSATLTFFLNGIGQNFFRANLGDPPRLDQEGNIAVNFRDGVFTSFGTVDTGGVARVSMTNGNTGTFGGGFAGGSFELIQFFPVSGVHRYRELTGQRVLERTGVPVPAPASSGLLALLVALGLLRWRGARGDRSLRVAATA